MRVIPISAARNSTRFGLIRPFAMYMTPLSSEQDSQQDSGLIAPALHYLHYPLNYG